MTTKFLWFDAVDHLLSEIEGVMVPISQLKSCPRIWAGVLFGQISKSCLFDLVRCPFGQIRDFIKLVPKGMLERCSRCADTTISDPRTL